MFHGCVDLKPLFEVFGSFLVLPSEQRGNSTWSSDLEEPDILITYSTVRIFKHLKLKPFFHYLLFI